MSYHLIGVLVLFLVTTACNGKTVTSTRLPPTREGAATLSHGVSLSPSELRAQSAPTTATSRLPAESLQVGDCFNNQFGERTTHPAEVSLVGCEMPHGSEVFHLDRYQPSDGKAPYPGDEVMLTFARERCEAAFQSYVDTPQTSSTVQVAFLYPSREAWDQFSRETICYWHVPG